MAYTIKTRDQHLENDGGAKRILALDGGGVRGMLTLGYLAKIEDLLRERHGGSDDFRLCHYFDLIAGTSTGAIIATLLARGDSVQSIVDLYRRLSDRVFGRQRGFGLIWGKYDSDTVGELMQEELKGMPLGDEQLQTGLLVMTKRLDTGSPWPLVNNPAAPYFHQRPGKTYIANSQYPLSKVVRASTAAPHYFSSEEIDIHAGGNGAEKVTGTFVDGGVSTANNPALIAFQVATLKGYRLGWPTGADRLMLTSVGTGAQDPSVAPSALGATEALRAMLSLMNDCADLVETMMQWFSESPTAREIDRDVGDLTGDLIAPEPLLTYLRYNVRLERQWLQENLQRDIKNEQARALQEMDNADNIELLYELGADAAERFIATEHFAPKFDLSARD